LIYAAGLYSNTIFVINPQSGMVIERFRTGRRPYRILFHPDGKSFFVSSWADGTVYHHEADSGRQIVAHRVAAHPTDMVWREEKSSKDDGADTRWKGRLFVAAANTNNVYAIGVTEGKELRTIESINVAMTPRQPVGMTPSALALNADGTRLFVVCSDANAVAVADVGEARSHVLGFVPSGWYPTAARSLPDGRLLVLNGKGGGSTPNPNGPNPTLRPSPVHQGSPETRNPGYVGRLQTGTMSIVDRFDDAALEQYTKTVLQNSAYTDNKLDGLPSAESSPLPTRPGESSPLQHVIYIVKENRTYDQVLGDLGKGNGMPDLTLFGEAITPNHHKIARKFVLFDNFYVNADVSADGHNWSTSAIAPDYVQKMWPNSYAARRRRYDYEGTDPASLPPAGYLWTNAAAAGVSMRNYGFWAVNLPAPAPDGTHIQSVRDPVLKAVTNLRYRAFDLEYPDVERAKVFLADLAQFEQQGSMPKLILMRLGNDHTSGVAPGKIAPRSAVADNDFALGTIVEAVSKSRFWPNTVIFVLEDDAQNGPDHVDSHRSPAFVISPYTRRAVVDSTMYNTTSMLRTMELILGLRPMTHFDAGARVMSAAFSSKPDARPYTAEKPRVPLDERNPSQTARSDSPQFDLSEADRIDDDEMNEVLWRSLRAGEPPAPVRSLFSR
jgi:DNA-binding beta-propeller fold protein YncE